MKGFAIIDARGIDIKTVSGTRRAAIVNWLVVEKGIFIYTQATDGLIEDLWTTHKGSADVAEVLVTVIGRVN